MTESDNTATILAVVGGTVGGVAAVGAIVGGVIWGVSTAGSTAAATPAAVAAAAVASKPTRFNPSQSYVRGYYNNGYYGDERFTRKDHHSYFNNNYRSKIDVLQSEQFYPV